MCVIEWSRLTAQAPEDAPRGLEVAPTRRKGGEALGPEAGLALLLRPSIRTARGQRGKQHAGQEPDSERECGRFIGLRFDTLLHIAQLRACPVLRLRGAGARPLLRLRCACARSIRGRPASSAEVVLDLSGIGRRVFTVRRRIHVVTF